MRIHTFRNYNTVKDNIFRCKIIVIIVIASKILRLKSPCLSNETGAINKKLSKKNYSIGVKNIHFKGRFWKKYTQQKKINFCIEDHYCVKKHSAVPCVENYGCADTIANIKEMVTIFLSLCAFYHRWHVGNYRHGWQVQ